MKFNPNSNLKILLERRPRRKRSFLLTSRYRNKNSKKSNRNQLKKLWFSQFKMLCKRKIFKSKIFSSRWWIPKPNSNKTN